MADVNLTAWRTSTRSPDFANCVEVATSPNTAPGSVLVRDSKDRGGPVLAFSALAWRRFTAGIRGGNLDR
jgi:hypothetical protein